MCAVNHTRCSQQQDLPGLSKGSHGLRQGRLGTEKGLSRAIKERAALKKNTQSEGNTLGEGQGSRGVGGWGEPKARRKVNLGLRPSLSLNS